MSYVEMARSVLRQIERREHETNEINEQSLLPGPMELPVRWQRDFPEEQSREEIELIARRIRETGTCLVWSEIVNDLVAFVADDATKVNVPPGFVLYTERELRELFATHATELSPSAIRLIHEAKKTGAVVTRSDVNPRDER